ncbi:TPM domain-containing protein [Hymenobacter sp. BT664]|uniref:TPM domain-containing protein n=1 Tax=Hymenobacter montanus TaxID=2771359 RepID=A0A927B9M3_9BACT|nr:TPM domain-containing protein [Hymenobacter montanus]MBD2766656.1 TPM domain-containing protein [Hymenobacter montanus]
MAWRYLHSFLLSACLLLTACGSSQTPPAADYLTYIPDPKTLGEAYVSDPDSILAPNTVADLNATLQALDQSGRAHLDVVLVKSIGEAVPKTAAYELFNRWKIGAKEKDNGLLMLLVLDQHRMEFETGYGLEADLPDIICYRIQQRYMVPLARANRYDEAVRQGVAAIIQHLANPSLSDASQPTNSATDAQDAGAAPKPPEAQTAAPDPEPSGSETQPQAQEEGAVTGPDLESTPTEIPPESRPEISPLGCVGIGGAGLAGFLLYIVLWQFTTEAGKWPRKLLGLSLLLPVGVVIVTFIAGVATLWLLSGVLYGLPLFYLHGYLGVVNYRARTIYAQQGRHPQYEYLNKAHYKLGFSAYVFPLLLAFYWPWHRRRLGRLRDTPYNCPGCSSPMHRLDEHADDEHLEPGQVAEERILSVDYDVWRCDRCARQLVFGYRNLATEALPCPACQHQTDLLKQRKTAHRATTSAPGWGWEHYQCAFCGHQHETKFIIPQLSESSSSSSSSGSSSSSSSSSSSGGSSGGGGAGSSW